MEVSNKLSNITELVLRKVPGYICKFESFTIRVIIKTMRNNDVIEGDSKEEGAWY